MRILLSLLSLLVTLGVSAQNEGGYHSLLKEGKTWNFEDRYFDFKNDEEWTKDVSYVINGTTEIDGKTYYKMYRISEEGNEYYCALREEGRKVWEYFDDGDQLLYDFSMSVGDSYMPIDEKVFKLAAINPIQAHDVVLNVFHYDVRIEYIFGMVDIIPVPVVEGVGCEEGWNLIRLFWEYPTCDLVHREYFLSCYEDGECIFTVDDFENITTNILHPKTLDTEKSRVIDYYSISGRRLSGQPTKGIYIQNGKKVVVK